MSGKSILFIILLALLVTTSCNGRNSEEMIQNTPPGFISLKTATEIAKGIMEISFFEEYVSLVDMDGGSVGGGLVTDHSFMIHFNGEYYVNEEKFLESLEIAKVSPEQRRKRYSLEDAIEIRGAGKTVYIVKITSFDSVRIKDVTTFTIQYTIDSYPANDGSKPYITNIEAKDGVTYSVFDVIDIETLSIDIVENKEIETKAFSISILRNSEIKTIQFLSPDYPWLDYIIAVNDP